MMMQVLTRGLKAKKKKKVRKLWDDLPKRLSGGLFYSPVKDEKNPGHNMTLLQVLKDPPFTIIPDKDIEGVERCQVILTAIDK